MPIGSLGIVASGETNADEPSYRRPPPPADRIWQHPSEVALHVRQRRRHVIRRNLSLCAFGTAVAAGVLWLGAESATDVGVTADLAAVVPGNAASNSSTTLSWADDVARATRADTVRLFSRPGAETLALALVVRDGFVITSGRGLEGHTEVLVAWGNRVELGTVIGHDALTDVSVIRLDAAVVPNPARASATPERGDMIALVNPEGASEPRMVVDPMSTSPSSDGADLFGVVELDRELGDLRPGTPAVDEDGAIIGIALATADGAPAAIVPIALARDVADEIIEHGEADHPRIGITARDTTDADNAGPEQGAYVAAVVADGPAAVGGIEQGDVIVSIQGTAVTSIAEMIGALRSHEPGEVVAIVVQRGDTPVNCSVSLGSHLDAVG